MKIKLFSLALLILTLFTACEQVFNPDIDEVEPMLVVEAYLTTIPGKHQVKLSISKSFNDKPYYDTEKGAIVYALDDAGNRIDYWERGNGIYETWNPLEVKGEIGRSYSLYVETKEGVVYQSTPQKLVECAEPTAVDCKYDQLTYLTEDSYGAPLEINTEGMEINISSKGALPIQNYYLFSWVGYEEHLSIMVVPNSPSNIYRYQHRRLATKYLTIIRSGNADVVEDHTLRNKKLQYINKADFETYSPPNPDSMSFGTDFEGLIYKVQQKSLTPEAYKFWNGAEEQLEASGKLFDPVATQINGNMVCTSDSTKKVLGIFTVSDVKEYITYLYINGQNRTTSIKLDVMPEIVTETYYDNIPPDGWISAPF